MTPVISNSDSANVDQDVKVVLQTIQSWFNSNRMLLNYSKTKFMHPLPNISHQFLDTIEFDTCKINSTNSIKFLGIIIEPSLTWNEHIDYINSKLNSLRYTFRFLRSVLELKILKQLFFSYVHSVLNYGIMFWGNSPHGRSIFITQKHIVRVIMEAKSKDSCKELFSKIGILILYSQYMFSILMFVVKNKDSFTLNMEFHKINTHHKLDFHIPLVSLTIVQKGVYYSGITLFNSLSLNIKQVAHDINKFKHKLKKFLILKSLFSVK
jgi:hypothetical protein